MASKSATVQKNTMASKNAAASLILALMFASLVIIYQVVPQTSLVTLLSVVLMAIGLIIAVVGSRSEVMMMAFIATATSLIAAYFLGQSVLGRVGSIAVPVVWTIILISAVRRITTRTSVVPEDHALMIAPFLSSEAYPRSTPGGLPLIPLLEQHVATIPLYELSQDVSVTKINIKARHNIDLVEAHVRYRVVDPASTLRNIPNRGQIQNEIARELARDLVRARLDVAFWEKLLARQLKIDLDDVIREVLYKEENATIAYTRRQEISAEVRNRVNEQIKRWGVEVSELELDHWEISPEVVKGINRAVITERETEMKEIEARREARRIEITMEAEARAEAIRIREIVKVLQESNINLTPEQLEEIVVSAIRASSEWSMENNFSLYPHDLAAAAPLPPKPDTGGRK